MTDLTQMIRWQAGLVRGLAQSVLERAKNIRGSLENSKMEASKSKKAAKRTSAAKKSARTRKTTKKHA